MILIALLESIVNRIADVIERVGSDMDARCPRKCSTAITLKGKRSPSHRDFRKLLERTGQSGELISKARESLASLARLVAFVQQSTIPLPPEVRTRLRTASKDVVAMSDPRQLPGLEPEFHTRCHAGHDQHRPEQYPQDIFRGHGGSCCPPSVIGAIFGMNFDKIPTAHEPWGFTAAVVLMVLSAVIPSLVFKMRGWL